MSHETKTYSKLPATLPFLLGSLPYFYDQERKRSLHMPFRRLYFKRRLTTGDYEASWQEISPDRIVSYGKLKNGLDSRRVNFFEQGSLSLKLWSRDGYFSTEDFSESFWFGYLTQQKTLCKLEVGYTHSETEEELPETDYVVFTGIFVDEIKDNFDGTVSMLFQPLTKIFTEVNGSALNTALLSTYTAGDILALIRDHTDANGTAVFQKYISTTAWNIQTSTSISYSGVGGKLALAAYSVWEVISRIAEAENFIAYTGGDGAFHFQDREANTTGAVFHFYGGSSYKNGGANTIIKMNSYGVARNKIYNRVRVKFLDADTQTSYFTVSDEILWGQTTSADTYGTREYKTTNTWIPDTATAQTIAENIFNEFSEPKKELHWLAKYDPSIQILDPVRVTYTNKFEDSATLWGTASWGTTLWSGSSPGGLDMFGKDFKIIEVEHDFDNFTSAFRGWET